MKIRKIIILITLLFLLTFNLSSTQQEPDEIIINGKKAYIYFSRGENPAIVQKYSWLKYPLKMLHTANYRGYVAAFEIKDQKLYLNSFHGGIEQKQSEYEKKELSPTIKDNLKKLNAIFFKESKGPVPVTWFSGFIMARLRERRKIEGCDTNEYYWEFCYKWHTTSIPIKIEKGKVLDIHFYEEDDYKKCYDLKNTKTPKECMLLYEYDYYYEQNRKSREYWW